MSIVSTNHFHDHLISKCRIYAGIKHQMDTPGVKGTLLTRAVAAKIDKMHKTSDTTHLLWDKLIFNKVGDNCPLCLTLTRTKDSTSFGWQD